MKLQLRDLLEGERRAFTDCLDLSGLDFGGQILFPEPVRLSGDVCKRAGVARLEGRYDTVMSARCDRCGKAFRAEWGEALALVLAERREAEDREDIYLLRDGFCDLREIFEPTVILSVPSKILCAEDCLGICPQCGRDWNEGSCDCAEKGGEDA